jgi:hypothetical protein
MSASLHVDGVHALEVPALWCHTFITIPGRFFHYREHRGHRAFLQKRKDKKLKSVALCFSLVYPLPFSVRSVSSVVKAFAPKLD